MSEEETQKEEPKEIAILREESKKKHLTDEQAIKVLNAQFVVNRSKIDADDPDQMHKHIAEVSDGLVSVVDGMQEHLKNEFVFVKEKMRNEFNSMVYKKGEERAILLKVAEVAYKGLADIFKDLEYVNHQIECIFQIVDEQAPPSLSERGKSLIKGVAMSPINVPLKITGLKKGKHEVR